MYSDKTVSEQYKVTADSRRNVYLDDVMDVFAKVRLVPTTRNDNKMPLPETLRPLDVKIMQTRMELFSEPIQMPQLFHKLHDRVAPRKVLIQGKAGIGKTTLVNQIAKQWAEEKLWKDNVEYLFVISLRQLQLDMKCTLGDLLLGGLPLTEDEKAIALSLLSESSKQVMLCLDGMDQAVEFELKTDYQPDHSKEHELNTILSSIIVNAMLPGAKIIIASRTNDTISSKVCHRTVEMYGFSQENINEYIHKFCEEDSELEQFITDYLRRNVNIAVLCYIPAQCKCVCMCLAEIHSSTHSADTSSVNTMTRLYVYAAASLARKHHPSLKGIDTQMGSKKIFGKIGNSLMKHAKLAKHCTMTTPLRIIIHEDDLDVFQINGVDKHTGFLSDSVTRVQIASGLTRTCWTFSHLTFHVMFAAVGLLRGPREAIMELIKDKTSVRQHGALITFITGLLCDPHNACFMNRLEPARDQLDPRCFLEKLASVVDPLQLTTFIHETQLANLVDLVPETVKHFGMCPTTMMSLCWVLKQQECRVTSLE